jgi:hypothetical protein
MPECEVGSIFLDSENEEFQFAAKGQVKIPSIQS